MKKLSYLIALVSLLGFNLHAQESLLDDFLEDKESKSFFLYQSTMRMFNEQENNADFNKLIKDLEMMRLYLISTQVDKSEFKSLFKKIAKKKYESVIEVDSKDFTVKLYVREKGRKTTYVLGALTTDGAFVADMKGSLNMKYLNALNNQSWLKNIEKVLPNNKTKE